MEEVDDNDAEEELGGGDEGTTRDIPQHNLVEEEEGSGTKGVGKDRGKGIKLEERGL